MWKFWSTICTVTGKGCIFMKPGYAFHIAATWAVHFHMHPWLAMVRRQMMHLFPCVTWQLVFAYVITDDACHYECTIWLERDKADARQLAYLCRAHEYTGPKGVHTDWSSLYEFDGLLSEREWKTRAKDEWIYRSSHHSFSLRTCSSSSGVKSFLMSNVLRISSGDLPLIMLATVLHVTSSSGLMSR